jgi:PKD repeat protein
MSVSIVHISPIASFTIEPGQESYGGSTIWFNDTSTSYGPLTSLTSWWWDFGDGHTSNSKDCTHIFIHSGTYDVTLRVVDSEHATNITGREIVIHDEGPKAAFSNTPSVECQITYFYDNSTTPAAPIVNWTWNLGDGTFAWSRDISHVYSHKGEFRVTLTVWDDEGVSNTTSRVITVARDQMPPQVVLGESVGSADLYQAVNIAAKVTDLVGVSSVTLHYRIDNGTEQIVSMTPQGSPDNYEAQIPGVNHTAIITYWIVAIDNEGNPYITAEYVISVEALSTVDAVTVLGLIIVVLAALTAFLYLQTSRTAVDEVFVIYEDGRLIAHQTRRLKPGMDDEILSSMLIAIQSFVKDSFKDEHATHLQRLDFGEKKILVEKGDHFFIAVVLHGGRVGIAPKKIKQVIDTIELEHGETLSSWDGDLERLRGVKNLTAPLIGKSLQRTAEAPEVQECPACGSLVGPDDEVCPSCGASLMEGDLEDLEAVASDLSQKNRDPDGKA